MACGFAATHHSAGALRLLRWLIQATNLGMVEHAGPSRNWSGNGKACDQDQRLPGVRETRNLPHSWSGGRRRSRA